MSVPVRRMHGDSCEGSMAAVAEIVNKWAENNPEKKIINVSVSPHPLSHKETDFYLTAN